MRVCSAGVQRQMALSRASCTRGESAKTSVDSQRSLSQRLLFEVIGQYNTEYNSSSYFYYISMQVEAKQVRIQRIGLFSKILFLISFPINYLLLRYTSSGQLINSYIFPELPSDSSLDESTKWLMMRLFLAKVGLFLFFNFFMIFICRVATKRIAPALDEDPVIIKFLNRILQNSLEQLGIFGSLYLYFLFDKAGDRFSFNELLVLASWFLYSRVVFLISYGLGTYINMVSLRSFGFAINMALNFMLIELCFCPTTLLSDHIFGK